jgi:Domain of unknown function (DUF6797)
MTHARSLRTVGVLAVVGWLAGGLIAPGSSPAPVQSPPRSQPGWAPFVEPDFPFLSSVLDARKLGPGWPADNLTPRGLILNLGHDAWACFDTDLLRMSAMWIGNGVTPASMSQGSYHVAGEKAPEGQGKLPQIAGTPWIANGIYPGWQIGDAISFADPRDPGPDPQEVGRGPIDPALGRLNAVRMAAGGTRLEYVVAGASVLEWVDARLQNDRPVIQRRFQLTGVKRPLWLIVGRHPQSQITLTVTGGLVDGNALAARVDQPDGVLAVRVSPSASPVEFQATLSLGPLTVPSGAGNDSAAAPPASTRWPQTVVTRGVLSSAASAYVIDRIALPLDNPWHRNVRLADIAFFGDGRAAAVTFDGDVWTISGLGGDLQDVRWKRFTSGLHEPLAIAVRSSELYVFDRNGIWRLRDTDGNGEADVHELFSNTFAQTAETREFASSMRAAPDGSFVIAKGGQEGTTVGRDNGSILRISPDGTEMTKLAYGLRQPFVSVHPKNGMITASDQQGNYIPSTPIHVITGTGSRYFGFIPLILPKEKYPAPIVEPLTWIPHSINASAASQVWLADARMGPLNDALIHIGYYRPEIFLVLLNRRAPRLQASVVSLTRELDFALARSVPPTVRCI